MTSDELKEVFRQMNEHRRLTKELHDMQNDELLARLERLNQRIIDQQARQAFLVNVAVMGMLAVAGVFAGALLWL